MRICRAMHAIIYFLPPLPYIALYSMVAYTIKLPIHIRAKRAKLALNGTNLKPPEAFRSEKLESSGMNISKYVSHAVYKTYNW